MIEVLIIVIMTIIIYKCIKLTLHTLNLYSVIRQIYFNFKKRNSGGINLGSQKRAILEGNIQAEI